MELEKIRDEMHYYYKTSINEGITEHLKCMNWLKDKKTKDAVNEILEN